MTYAALRGKQIKPRPAEAAARGSAAACPNFDLACTKTSNQAGIRKTERTGNAKDFQKWKCEEMRRPPPWDGGYNNAQRNNEYSGHWVKHIIKAKKNKTKSTQKEKEGEPRCRAYARDGPRQGTATPKSRQKEPVETVPS